MNVKKKTVTLVAAVGLAPALMVAGTQAAHADVTTGQYVSNKGHVCGGHDYITGSTKVGPVELKQHAYIYRHCGKGSVKRRANVIAGKDGPCLSIPAGKSRVIKQLYTAPRTVYRGDYRC